MYILFDIGGTKMRVAYSEDLKIFEEPQVEKTPFSFEEGITLFKKMADKVSAGRKIEIVSGGISGSLDLEKEKLDNSPNISGWVDKPLKKKLEELFTVPVVIENDASVVGLGEAHFGAGIGFSIVCYITVSTGVGGSRIVDGKIDKKFYGFEPGKQYIDISLKENGTLEELVSGSSIKNNLNKEPYEIREESFWDDLAQKLSFGLCNISYLWSPEIIVLGGSMIVGDPNIKAKRVQYYLEKINKRPKVLPKIKEAKLKDFGGLYGALILAKNFKK